MLVIGNGESRKDINVDALDCKKIGCNAIMRDYRVDHLVCCDRRMVEESIQSNYNKMSYVYTRKDWLAYFSKHTNIKQVPNLPYNGNQRPDDPFHWGSGPYAVLLASKLTKNNNVKLIGFDLYSDNKQVNNVYKGTKNYANNESRAVDPRYWIYQIAKVFESFPNIKYEVFVENDWVLPKFWNQSHVRLDNIQNIYYNT